MRLYFVRHGQSTANLLEVFSNRGLEHPLTEKGVAQAHALACSLDGLSVAQIYASPLLRAMQTAQILAKRLPAPMQTTEALQEWDVGIYEGTTDAVGWELHRQVQEDWFIHQDFDSRMPGGESFHQIQARFRPFIEEVVSHGGNSNQNIVLVGHGGLYTAMLPVILTNVDFAFARQHGFANTASAVAETRPDGIYCLSWCGIPLDGSG